MNPILVEALGWIAMFITISSFFFHQMKTLRVVNLIGCLVWMIYGTLIVSTPIVLTNVAILLTHAFWFMKNSKAVDRIK
jgi:hypothetical protein